MDLIGPMKQVAETMLPKSADMVTRIGIIDPAYTSGRPRVLFDGESSLTGITQTYPYINSYKPVASQKVQLLKSGGTWVILGATDEVGLPGAAPVSTRSDGVGRYYSNAAIGLAGTSGTQVFSTGTTYYLPVHYAVATKIDRLAFIVSSAGTTVEMARYTPGTNGVPLTRVTSYGSISVATTGTKEYTISETIPAGVAWFGFTATGSNVAVYIWTNAVLPMIAGDAIPSAASGTTHYTQTISAPPATTTSPSASNASVPCLYWRISA